MQIILVRHSEADHNRNHSYGKKQEFDPLLTADGEVNGIEEAIACGDALVQYLFDGQETGKEWEKDFAWQQFAESIGSQRHAPGKHTIRAHPQPMRIEPREVQLCTSIFPRARQSAQRIAHEFHQAGFPLRPEQCSESAQFIETDMPYKRMNRAARASLKGWADRYPDTEDAKQIRILVNEKQQPAIIANRYPYAPRFEETQEQMLPDLQKFLDHCAASKGKVGIIVGHAVGLHTLRGLLCNIPRAALSHMRPQGNGSALVIDLPDGIGSGTTLGYIHGQEYQRTDKRGL